MSLVQVTKSVNVKTPTLNKYSHLYSQHSKTLTCPCTTISVTYEKFLRIQYVFHEVCSSIFVTNVWINYIDGRSSNTILAIDDFRWTGPNTFRALSGFCELINKTISENLIRFYSTQYVSATITSTQLFQSTAQYFFEQFISSTTQDLLLSLQVIRDTVQADSLWSVAGIQYRLQKYNNSRNLSLNVRSLSGCSCDDSAKCIRQSSIYRYSDQTRLFSVQGQYVGCFVTEALLQSSLQCFYNQTCINELRTYLTYNSSLIVTALNASLLNRFFENSTIQELVDKLMIEQWNLSTTFESYYNACQPRQCTYTYAARNDIIYIVTILFGLAGGLVTVLKFIVPRLVKLVRNRKRFTKIQPGKRTGYDLFI
ncbi:unnamed protein product [Rotaria sp. Silwood1]|nr:unnamed protein product [Rotaria sp. Silwood1]